MGVGVLVAVGVNVAVAVAVGVGEGVGVLVAVAVGVADGVAVGVNVAVGVEVGVNVDVGVGVGVAVAGLLYLKRAEFERADSSDPRRAITRYSKRVLLLTLVSRYEVSVLRVFRSRIPRYAYLSGFLRRIR